MSHRPQLSCLLYLTVEQSEPQRFCVIDVLDAPRFSFTHIVFAPGYDRFEVASSRHDNFSMHNVVRQKIQRVTLEEGAMDHRSISTDTRAQLLATRQ